MVGVCNGRRGELDDDVGFVVVIDSAVGGSAGLELDIVNASSALLFEKGSDDAGGRLDMFG